MSDAEYIVVGNKSDLEDEREISIERVKEFSELNDISFHMETSALTGDNIELLFETLIRLVLKKVSLFFSHHLLHFHLERCYKYY